MEDERLSLVRDVVRQLLLRSDYQIMRVAEGVSTWVYRLERNSEYLYLRVLPEEGASFAPEVAVHTALCDAGVRVPEVIAWEHYNAALGRSVMVTTAIAGRDLRSTPVSEIRTIIKQAGRDLAIINQLTVDGFGWVKRDSPVEDRLLGEHPSFAAWFADDVEPFITLLRLSGLLGRREIETLDAALQYANNAFNDQQEAWLAHGDFDLTHVFADGDSYTGIIDFGEIRGAYALYDLGHFAIEQESFLGDLLAGYADIVTLPRDYLYRIKCITTLIAARRAGIFLKRGKQPLAADIAAIQKYPSS